MTNIAHLCVIHTVPQSRTRDEDSNPEFIQTNKYICGSCNLSTPSCPITTPVSHKPISLDLPNGNQVCTDNFGLKCH